MRSRETLSMSVLQLLHAATASSMEAKAAHDHRDCCQVSNKFSWTLHCLIWTVVDAKKEITGLHNPLLATAFKAT